MTSSTPDMPDSLERRLERIQSLTNELLEIQREGGKSVRARVLANSIRREIADALADLKPGS